jgi:2-dehydro-3-deoxygalactonokinase
MKNHFLSCDWGTTNFRLRLVHNESQKIVHEWVANEGIAQTFQAWKATKTADRTAYFKAKLKTQIRHLAAQSKQQLDGLDIVLSGMAASSIGMHELPYATLPFALDGSNAHVHILEAGSDFSHKIHLISGVQTADDVMRGEETQLVGLMQLANLNTEGPSIVIIPGTHSKHIHLNGNQVIGIQTFMTGELFNILSNHSILKDSIDLNSLQFSTKQDREAFQKGVLEAAKTGLFQSLFKVRTNQLLSKLPKKENGFYLSGLLIGAELSPLKSKSNTQFVLCCGENLFEFYRLTFETLGLLDCTNIVEPELMDKSVVVGQWAVLKNKAPQYK